MTKRNPPPTVAPAPHLPTPRTRTRAILPTALEAPPPAPVTLQAHIETGAERPSKFATVSTGKVKDPDILRPARVPPPAPLTYDHNGDREERALAEEQEVTRVETLMLKGVRDTATICKLLGCTRTIAERRIRRVWARWEVTGGASVMKRARGEAIARSARLVLKLEEILQDTKDNREKIVALKELHTLGAYLDTLRGLTPDAIARLNMVADSNPVAARALKADKELSLLSDLVNRLKAKASGDTGQGQEDDDAAHLTIEGLASRSPTDDD